MKQMQPLGIVNKVSIFCSLPITVVNVYNRLKIPSMANKFNVQWSREAEFYLIEKVRCTECLLDHTSVPPTQTTQQDRCNTSVTSPFLVPGKLGQRIRQIPHLWSKCNTLFNVCKLPNILHEKLIQFIYSIIVFHQICHHISTSSKCHMKFPTVSFIWNQNPINVCCQ